MSMRVAATPTPRLLPPLAPSTAARAASAAMARAPCLRKPRRPSGDPQACNPHTSRHAAAGECAIFATSASRLSNPQQRAARRDPAGSNAIGRLREPSEGHVGCLCGPLPVHILICTARQSRAGGVRDCVAHGGCVMPPHLFVAKFPQEPHSLGFTQCCIVASATEGIVHAVCQCVVQQPYGRALRRGDMVESMYRGQCGKLARIHIAVPGKRWRGGKLRRGCTTAQASPKRNYRTTIVQQVQPSTEL